MTVTKAMSLFMIVTGISIALYSKIDFFAMLMIGNGILSSILIVYLGMFFHNLRAPEVSSVRLDVVQSRLDTLNGV
jgi:hypothetical protein